MSKLVHLTGELDNFRAALVDRLERAGAILTNDSESADVRIAIGKAAEGAESDIAIIGANDDPRSGSEKEVKSANLLIRIHDLMIPDGSQGWGPAAIEDWINWAREGALEAVEPDIEVRHWVHIRDASDAITLLALSDSDAFVHGIVDLCGRRAWGPDAVLAEISLLWGRFTDAVGYTHTTQSLADIPSPAAVQYEGDRRRPNLKPLHEEMVRAGREEGWRPLTPMRVALMELLAHAELKSDKSD